MAIDPEEGERGKSQPEEPEPEPEPEEAASQRQSQSQRRPASQRREALCDPKKLHTE